MMWKGLVIWSKPTGRQLLWPHPKTSKPRWKSPLLIFRQVKSIILGLFWNNYELGKRIINQSVRHWSTHNCDTLTRKYNVIQNQNFAGLKPTGKMDKQTKILMNTPRWKWQNFWDCDNVCVKGVAWKTLWDMDPTLGRKGDISLIPQSPYSTLHQGFV